MNSVAKSNSNLNGSTDVLVFSVSTKKLEGYTINSYHEDEPGGFSATYKSSSPKAVSQESQDQFASLAEAYERIRDEDAIDIPTNICSDSLCLNQYALRAQVDLFLRAEYNIDITINTVVKGILGHLIDDFEVVACFADGVCVEFTLVSPASSISFVATSDAGVIPVGAGSDYVIDGAGIDGAVYSFSCVEFTDFYQSGVLLYSWCSRYERTLVSVTIK